MSALGYVHHSGRFNRTGAALGAALAAQAQLPGVSVIGVTETARKARDRGAREALSPIGWDYAHPEYAECGLAYDRDAWQLLDLTMVQVSQYKTWSKTGHLRSPFTVPMVSMRSKVDHLVYTFTVGHTPSAVQAGHHWRHNGRARQHRDGLKGWRQALRRYHRDHPAPGGTVVSMDANLDIRLAVWRRYLRRSFPGYTLVTDPHPQGTHAGGRAIDVTLVSRQLRARRWWRGRKVRVLRAPDSDHRSIMVRLARKLVRR